MRQKFKGQWSWKPTHVLNIENESLSALLKQIEQARKNRPTLRLTQAGFAYGEGVGGGMSVASECSSIQFMLLFLRFGCGVGYAVS